MAARLVACMWMAALAWSTARAEEAAVWPTAGWAVSAPEAQGVDSAALADLIDFGRASAMDSLLVTRHGRLIADAYYAPFART